MPLVQITMLEGRDREKKEQLIQNVTESIHQTLSVPKERVHVFIYDMPATDCGNAGVSVAAQMSGED